MRKGATKTVWFDFCNLQLKLFNNNKNYMRNFLNDFDKK